MDKLIQDNLVGISALINQLPMGVAVLDANGRFLHFNPSLTRITGYTLADIKNKDEWFIKIYPDPDYRETVSRDWAKALEKGNASRVFDITCKTGEIKTIEFHASFLSDGMAMMVLSDISDRKAAEAASKKRQNTIESIFKAAPAGIGMVVDRVITKANDRLCEMIGYESSELLGKNARILYPTDEEFEFVGKEKYRQVTKKGTGTVETRWKHKNGRILNILLSSTPINPDDWADGVTFTSLDITETKQMEIQLRQAQKMEAIGTLVGGISHDFNNLLQAIGGYTELLQMDKDESHPDFFHIGSLRKATTRAGDLVRQLLVFSREADTKKRAVQVNAEVAQVENLLEKTIPKMISIQLNLSDRLWNVYADPLQIEQVLLNLGSNAADSMPDGGKITIETKNTAVDTRTSDTISGLSPGNYVCLTVQDTGYGMDKSVQEKIFEPFFTTKEIGKGTGLGLSSVYGIVTGHDGIITCESEIGKGTSFTIYLPAFEGALVEEQNLIPPRLKSGKEAVLLVDDEAGIIEVAQKAFQKMGYTFYEAESGETAIQTYKRHASEIDLVILDLSMPGMGGYKCLKTLLDINPGVKVLISSGYSGDTTINDCLEIGAADYIRKPYQLSSLFSHVRTILDKT